MAVFEASTISCLVVDSVVFVLLKGICGKGK
jgi:hypothetical protein